jgi:hypothetical protein
MTRYTEQHKKCIYYLHFIRNRLKALNKLDTELHCIFDDVGFRHDATAEDYIESLLELFKEIEQ